jgi:hypothetical protein
MPFTRAFSSSDARRNLTIGFVPEHFSTPLHFAQEHYSLPGKLVPYPSGTGHMIQSLKDGEIDVGIGLTEAWVAGLSSSDSGPGELPYKIVGSYVASPLCWAISAGANSKVKSVDQLRGGKIGVSRIGSGSYVMPFVLADQKGWLDAGSDKVESENDQDSHGAEVEKDQLQGGKIGVKGVGKREYTAPAAHASKGHVAHQDGEHTSSPFEFVPLGTFEKLRNGTNDGTIDAFMWEHFTSKRYYDNGEIKRIGEIYTPWASWKIVAKNPEDENVRKLLDSINKGISHFEKQKEDAVKYIYTNLDYSEEDARAWLDTVEFEKDVSDPIKSDLEKAYKILKKAGVIKGSITVEEMVGKVQ